MLALVLKTFLYVLGLVFACCTVYLFSSGMFGNNTLTWMTLLCMWSAFSVARGIK